MKHANLSIFVPHAGCPHQCSFCRQQVISGVETPVTPEQVTALCKNSVAKLPPGREAEIAFFGGSFTALSRQTMIALLEAAFPFVEKGPFTGIRISTRPDYIHPEILALLARYQVQAIELGAQSMDDSVLEQNKRGHTAEDVKNASRLIRGWGFSLGLQMMTGLFGSDPEKDWKTAEELAKLQPETMRIYPTIVLEGTQLAQWYEKGIYHPQTLSEAVTLGAELLGFFEERSIRVIRMGLHDEPSLSRSRMAGPYHPAFRELCEGWLMALRAEKILKNQGTGHYQIWVSSGGVSKMLGHGAFPVEYLQSLGYNIEIKKDAALSGLDFWIKDVENASAQLGNTGL